MNEQIRAAIDGARNFATNIVSVESHPLTARQHILGLCKLIEVVHARYAGSGEAIAEVVSKHGDPESFGERDIKLLTDIQKLPYRTKLYTHPPAQPQVPDGSPTKGMNLGERIAHVGGRENEQGYIEFGSVMAVDALINHVLRDISAIPAPAVPEGYVPVPLEPLLEVLKISDRKHDAWDAVKAAIAAAQSQEKA